MGQKTEEIFERAKFNLERENHENALRLLNEVLNREPGHKRALRNKAIIKILNDKREEAEEFLKFAIKQQPEDDQLYQMLGTLYHNNDQPAEARKQFLKAIKYKPSNILAHHGLAMIYANRYSDHEKAIDYFTEAIRLSEGDADLYFSRGCSHLILDHKEEAKIDLQRASELDHQKAKEMLKEYFPD